MKLAKTSKTEINNLFKLCQELERFYKNKTGWEEDPFNKKNFPRLSKLGNPDKDMEDFLLAVCRQFDEIHYQRIIWNLLTLLDNCADKGMHTLEFNPQITAGLEALNLLEEHVKTPMSHFSLRESQKKAKAILKMAKRKTLKSKAA